MNYFLVSHFTRMHCGDLNSVDKDYSSARIRGRKGAICILACSMVKDGSLSVMSVRFCEVQR